jgi:16S rRNA (guanine527-N7)-methyltransferase
VPLLHFLHSWFGDHQKFILHIDVAIGYNPRCMTHDRISELLAPFLDDRRLSEVQLAEVSTYAELLIKWNAHINLTSIRSPEEIIARHFGESLFAARQLLSADAQGVKSIDVGSGAGFPGLPLKIWNSALNLTLVEAHGKKAVFLREVARALGFSGVKVFADRAENLKEQADLVVLRAVERFDKILPVAADLVAPAGRLALLIGDVQIESARSILTEPIWENPVVLPLSRGRSLLVGHWPASR